MASVARAIEQAASKSVNGDLWWEPHTALFYALDKCGLGTVGGGRENPSEGEARLVSFSCALNYKPFLCNRKSNASITAS